MESNIEERCFHLFPSLPTEIRLKIFELTISPRYCLRGVSRPVPVILQICRESREEGLRHYKLLPCFKGDRPFYIAPELDMLYIYSVRRTLNLSVPDDSAIRQVAHLALAKYMWHKISWGWSGLENAMRTSEKLKMLTLVTYSKNGTIWIDHEYARKRALARPYIYRGLLGDDTPIRDGWNKPQLRFAKVVKKREEGMIDYSPN